MTSVSKSRFQKIYVPILIEQLFMMLMGQADVIMLSAYDTKAIAVSGISTQILTLLTFVITIVHVGVSIRLVHQKERDMTAIKSELYHSLTLNLVLSAFLGITALICYRWILMLMQVSQDIFELTYQFGVILLLGFAITTAQMLVSTILRILYMANIAAKITVGINIINIILSCCILFVFTDYVGNPILAVAVATLMSRLLGLLYGGYYLIKKYKPQAKFLKLNMFMTKKVILLGLPGAGEQISYNVAQTITTAFIAVLGTEVLAAKSLTVAISNVSFCVAMAYSLASQIYLGKLIARRKFNVLHRSVYKGLAINVLRSAVIMVSVVGVFYSLGRYISGDDSVYHLTLSYLMLFIALEPIRAINNFIVDILNVAGDVRYPVCVNVITTWCLLIPLSYLTAFVLGWGYIGIILINIFEEGVRFILIIRRWDKGHWKMKLAQIGVHLHV